MHLGKFRHGTGPNAWLSLGNVHYSLQLSCTEHSKCLTIPWNSSGSRSSCLCAFFLSMTTFPSFWHKNVLIRNCSISSALREIICCVSLFCLGGGNGHMTQPSAWKVQPVAVCHVRQMRRSINQRHYHRLPWMTQTLAEN